MSPLGLVLFLLFAVCLILLSISQSTLLSIIVVHRHGDKTPVEVFPTDLNKCYWSQGLGALTESGLQRSKRAGNVLRKRYRTLLTTKSTVSVYSSQFERCVKSVKSLIEGLYDIDFLSDPIPIFTVPAEVDGMLSFNAECPTYDVERDRVMQLPEHLEWANKSMTFWAYASEKTGQKFNYRNVIVEKSLWKLFDNLHIQKDNNLTLSNWMSESVLHELHATSMYTQEMLLSTQKLKMLKAGLLLNEIRNQIKAIQATASYSQLRIYSTHDLIVSALMMSLNVYNDILIPYSANLIFEFHSNFNVFSGYEHYLKVYYLNNTDSGDFYPLELPGCTTKNGCLFETFISLIEKLVPADWNNECKLKLYKVVM